MLMTVFQLLDACNVCELAEHAADFDALCADVSEALANLRATYQQEDIKYVITSTYYACKADPEEVCWLFLLFHPEHRFLRRLDAERSAVLDKARALDPEEFAVCEGYYDTRVEEKLGCTHTAGVCVVRYWLARPVFSEDGEINLPYLLKKSQVISLAEPLYALYRNCSAETAKREIQRYHADVGRELSAQYPGGKQIVWDAEPALQLSLPYDPEERKREWLKLPHLFFKKHAQAPDQAAALCFDYLKNSIFRYALGSIFVFADRRTIYGGRAGEEHGEEQADSIRFYRMVQHSYHDGGGGSQDSWSLSALKESKTPPAERMTETYYAKRSLTIPPCDGYWEEASGLYVKDPFGMRGVFQMGSKSKTWD